MKKNIYDKEFKKLLNKIGDEVQRYSKKYIGHINKLSEIGIALHSKQDINKILEMIIEEAKNITNADAGTLYLVEDDHLKFEILFNDTMGVKLGGTTNKPIKLPPVPIKKDSVSGYVALTGEIVNIEDVYENDEFNFEGPKKYDAKTGYRSKSFLCTPLKNHEDKIIGVLQLINAKDEKTGESIPFSEEYEQIIFSLASQAGITMTKTQLIKDIDNLFKSFVKVMATAIDERTPYNRKHTERVADLTVKIARAINDSEKGKYSDVNFSDDEIEELNMAAWLHDVGKVATPVHVMNKSTKLESINSGIDIIRYRINSFISDLRVKYLEKMIPQKKYKKNREKMEEYLKTIREINKQRRPLTEKQKKILESLNKDTYINSKDEEKSYITRDEYKKLSINRGNLTFEEMKIMKNHVVVTKKLLTKMPFIEKYKNVPEIASTHHEKLNGTGYPEGLTGDEIPMGGKIIAVADFYDALTASDRPYKDRMEDKKALKIMEAAAKRNEIDKELLRILKMNVLK
ncbi:MAG TPA: HD domain-containing phosphohydrolase [Candidatus Mcinerneyibacterium sp.]|nr:HD domain-containing phosphohydrolase [Candidatus Mcinerneyibacterium sp.]